MYEHSYISRSKASSAGFVIHAEYSDTISATYELIWSFAPLRRSLKPLPIIMTTQRKMAACIFCKIIKGIRHSLYWLYIDINPVGDIPSLKLFENDKVFAFLDIQPLSRGHAVRPTALLEAALINWR